MTAALVVAGSGIFTALLLCFLVARWPLVVLAGWLAAEPYSSPRFADLMRRAASVGPESSPDRLASILLDVLTLNHLVVGAFLLVLAIEVVRGQRPRPALGALDALMALFSVLLLASVALLANNKDHALRTAGDAFILPFLIALVARVLVTDWAALRTLLGGVSVLGCTLAIHGLIERATIADGLHRIQGPFQNKGLFGAVLVVVFVALVLCARKQRFLDAGRRWVRAAYEVALHLVPAVLFFSFSRGAWLAFVLAMGLLLLAGRGLFSVRRMGAVASVSAGVIALWSVSLIGQQVETRDRVAREKKLKPAVKEVIDRHVTNPRTVGYRTRAWRLLLPTISERPLMGLGLGNSVDYLATRTIPSPRGKTAYTAHSGYMSILFEGGLSAFACFLGIQALIAQRGIALVRAAGNGDANWLGMMLLALTIAYAVPGITSNSFFRPTVGNFLYYALVGSALALGARRAAWEAAGGADRPPCAAV